MNGDHTTAKDCERGAEMNYGYYNKPKGAILGAGMACEARQSSKSVLRQRIASLRQEADRLEALARALPEELPQRADEALWDLLLSKR